MTAILAFVPFGLVMLYGPWDPPPIASGPGLALAAGVAVAFFSLASRGTR